MDSKSILESVLNASSDCTTKCISKRWSSNGTVCQKGYNKNSNKSLDVWPWFPLEPIWSPACPKPGGRHAWFFAVVRPFSSSSLKQLGVNLDPWNRWWIPGTQSPFEMISHDSPWFPYSQRKPMLLWTTSCESSRSQVAQSSWKTAERSFCKGSWEVCRSAPCV